MRTNLEKWNYYFSIVEDKTNKFYQSLIKENPLPEKFYMVYPSGTISVKVIDGYEYGHFKHNWHALIYVKKPSKINVERIKEYSETDIPFTKDNLYIKYKDNLSRSTVSYNDLINKINLFYELEEAQKESEKYQEIIKFKEFHKKDPSYNYKENGYKFLGWMNNWPSELYDEDNNLCSETGKPSRSFGYSKEKYPEYKNCIDMGHERIEVSHYSNGSENTVSCPICKIYWKYDSSD